MRPKLLWAAGLRDVRDVGKGYTGHCFNDFNHVDATTMLMHTADNEHDGSVRGMLYTRARALIIINNTPPPPPPPLLSILHDDV